MNKFTFLLLCYLVLCCVNINAQGWQWGLGSTNPGGECYPAAAATDHSGNFYIIANVFPVPTGSTFTSNYGTLPLTDTGGLSQMAIIKTNSEGNYKWVIGTQGTYVSPVDITTDESGNVYVLGTYSFGPMRLGSSVLTDSTGGEVYFIAKSDSNGSVLWARNIGPGNYSPPSLRKACGLRTDNQGNIYVSGMYSGDSIRISTTTLMNASPGTTDIFVAKFNTGGTPLWAKSIGGVKMDYVNNIAVSSGGEVYISGNFSSPSIVFGGTTFTTALDAQYIFKFDSLGNELWGRTAQSTDSNDVIFGVTTDISGNIYISGTLYSDSLSFGGIKMIKSGDSNPFIVKYNHNGAILWAHNATGGAYYNYGFSIAVDSCENAWVCGQVQDNINFGGRTIYKPSYLTDVMFIADFNTAGDCIADTTLPVLNTFWSFIAIGNNGSLYAATSYQADSLILGSDTLYSATGTNSLLAGKYNYTGASCISLAVAGSVAATNYNLFPNPATTDFTIHSETPFPKASRAELYNLTGRLINTYPLTGNSTDISTANLLPGMYQCRIYSAGNNPVTKKLVIMK